MTRTNQILIGALVVQTGLVALVWSSGSERSLRKLEPIVTIEAAAVTKIEIYDRLDAGKPAPTTPKILLAKQPEGWVLASHFNYPVKKTEVDSMIKKLEAMRARGPVTTKDSRHRQLRVAADRYERKLVIHAGGTPTTLYVGSAAGRGKTAIRNDGAAETFGASGITSYAIATAARNWVESDYFKKGSDAVTELTIAAAGGNYQFKRADGDAPWKRFDGEAEVPVPEGKELNDGAVDALANIVGRIILFEPADPAKPPTVQSTVSFKAGDKTHVLKIGQLVEDRFVAAVDDKVPVLVNKSSLEKLVDIKDDAVYRDPPKEGETPPPAGGAAPQLPPGLPPGFQLPPGAGTP